MPIPLDIDFSGCGEDAGGFPLISKDLLGYSFGNDDGLNKSAVLVSQMQRWLATEGEVPRKRVNRVERSGGFCYRSEWNRKKEGPYLEGNE